MRHLPWTALVWWSLPLHVLALFALRCGWRRSVVEAWRHNAQLWRWCLDYERAAQRRLRRKDGVG